MRLLRESPSSFHSRCADAPSGATLDLAACGDSAPGAADTQHGAATAGTDGARAEGGTMTNAKAPKGAAAPQTVDTAKASDTAKAPDAAMAPDAAKAPGDVQVEETFAQYTRIVAYFEAHPPPPADTAPGDPAVAMANIRRGAVELGPHLASSRATRRRRGRSPMEL